MEGELMMYGFWEIETPCYLIKVILYILLVKGLLIIGGQ